MASQPFAVAGEYTPRPTSLPMPARQAFTVQPGRISSMKISPKPADVLRPCNEMLERVAPAFTTACAQDPGSLRIFCLEQRCRVVAEARSLSLDRCDAGPNAFALVLDPLERPTARPRSRGPSRSPSDVPCSCRAHGPERRRPPSFAARPGGEHPARLRSNCPCTTSNSSASPCEHSIGRRT